jgi:hypothetical protein
MTESNIIRKVYYEGRKVTVRSTEDRDLSILWKLIYGEANPEWKKWDAPYFPLKPLSFE